MTNSSYLFYKLGCDNHIDRIIGTLSEQYITVLGNGGFSGNQLINLKEIDKLFNENASDRFEYISEDERTKEEFNDFIFAKTDQSEIDHEILSSFNIYTLNSLPPEDVVSENIIIIDRSADINTIKDTCNIILDKYSNKKIHIIYYACFFCLSLEETRETVKRDNERGIEIEQEITRYKDDCKKGDILKVLKSYEHVKGLNYFWYGINFDIEKETDNAFARYFHNVDKAIRDIDIAEIEKLQGPIGAPLTHFDKWSKKIENTNKKINAFKDAYSEGISVEEPELFVDYEYQSTKYPDSYPFLYSPSIGTPIFPYRRHKMLREGVSEENFFLKIKEYLNSKTLSVYKDVSLHIFEGQYPVEPDIAIVSNAGKKLRIDIEIDEPYSGYDRTPIHYIGCDDVRDQNLIDCGWMVIRLSEEQVVTSPINCILFISKVISDIIPSFDIPQKLVNDVNNSGESFMKMMRWTKKEAIIMADENYRETYLKRKSFGYVDNLPESAINLKQTTTEAKLSLMVDLERVMNEKVSFSSNRIKVQYSQTADEAKIKNKISERSQTTIVAPTIREERVNIVSPYESTIEELMRPYFTSMSHNAYHRYDKDQIRLEQEVILYYGNINRTFIESHAFSLVKEYINKNNIVPSNVGMQIRHSSYHVNGKIGFLVGQTLYDIKIYRPVPVSKDYEKCIGVAGGLEDVPRNRYAVEETIKAIIVEQTLKISIKEILVLEVNSNTLKEYKIHREKVANFILNGGKYDISVKNPI